MTNAYLVSLYDRLEEYPNEYSLAAMRLAAHSIGLPGLNLKILPFRLGDPAESIAAELVRRDADVVGFSSYIWTAHKSKEVASVLAGISPATLTVIGGPNAAVQNPADWPTSTLFVVGEGEKPFRWVLESRLKDPKFMGENASSLHPTIFSHLKPRSQVVRQFDKELAVGIPIYSEEFMRVFEHPDQVKPQFTWHDTVVGCPYACGYCGHRTRPAVATRPDSTVQEEIKNIDRLGIKEVFIIDPILGGIPGRDRRVLEWYGKYAPNTKIRAYSRAEYLTDETIECLSTANISKLIIGLQSTNPNVPSWLRSNNLAKVKQYLPQLSRRGVPSMIELIVGMPGDDFAGLRESLRFVIDEIQPTTVRAYHLTIIPGTLLHGILDADQKGSGFWVHADPVSSRAISANSYSGPELNRMLVYAMAITSLYNLLKDRGDMIIRGQPITLGRLEQIVLPDIKQGRDTAQIFESTDNRAGPKAYWDGRV